MPTLEQLFARFAEHADSSALAEVFDRLAPGLLRLALHLTRADAEAEDVLQATFLVAMQRARTFDAKRSLEAWLVGILQNKATEHLRQRARSSARAAADVPDPLELASTGESRAAVRQALLAIEPLYREPLRLRYVEGLSTVEIAVRLERSPVAVRVQLHRGLALLEKLLPPGLALALVVPARGLAAVREAVLAQSSAVPVGLSVVVGGLVIKKLVAGVLVVCALVWGAWWSLRGEHSLPADSEAVNGSVAAVAGVGTTSRLIAATRTDAAGNAAPSPAQKEPRGSGSLVVRVVARGLAAPLPDVLVQVTALQGNLARFASQSLRTDERGEARFAELPAGRVSVYVLWGPVRELVIERGCRQDVLLEILDSCRITGEVVDGAGEPVAGAEIWERQGLNDAYAVFVRRADEHGRFELTSPGGRSALGARAPGGLASTFLMPAPGSSGATSLRLVVLPTGADLVGSVRDQQGNGLPAALVEIRTKGFDLRGTRRADGCFEHGLGTTRIVTDARGEFSACGVPAGTLRISSRVPERGVATVELSIGQREHKVVELRLDTCARVVGTVRDRSGRALAGVKVVHVGKRDLEYVNRYEDDAAAVSDADGSYVLDALVPGAANLNAYEPALRQFDIDLDLLAGVTTSWHPVLEAKPTLSGILVDEAKRPLPLWTVRAEGTDPDGGGGTGKTDATGRFTLPVEGRDRFRFQVTEPGVTFWIALPEPESVAIGAHDLVLVVPDALRSLGILSGRVVAADPHWLESVQIGITNGIWVAREFEKVAKDGSFRFGPLPPGRYWVALQPNLPGAVEGRFGPFTISGRGEQALGDLVVANPAQLEVRLAMREKEPTPDVQIELRHAGYPEVSFTGNLPIRAGVGRASLLPGTYELSIFGSSILTTIVPLIVSAGERKSLEVLLEPAVRPELRFPVPEPPGWAMVKSVTIVLRRATGESIDDDDEAPVAPGKPVRRFYALTVGGYVMRIATDTGRSYEARFEVRSLATPAPPIEPAFTEVR